MHVIVNHNCTFQTGRNRQHGVLTGKKDALEMKRESRRKWTILTWNVSGTLMKNYDRRSKIFVQRGEIYDWTEKKNRAKEERRSCHLLSFLIFRLNSTKLLYWKYLLPEMFAVARLFYTKLSCKPRPPK